MAAERDDSTTGNAKDMKLLWKIKLDNQTRQMHSLFPPLIVGSATTSAGPKQIAVVAGVSDNLFGIDVEKGRFSGRTSTASRSRRRFRVDEAAAFSVREA